MNKEKNIMRDILLDIVKHTHSLGFIQNVKIEGNDGSETNIEAMDDDRSVVLKGKLHNPVTDLKGTIGLGKLGVLSGYLNFEGYNDASSKINVVKRTRNEQEVAEELEFVSTKGYSASYRFMVSQLIEEKLKTVKFRGVNWDIEFEPSMAAVTRLTYQVQANSEETSFVAKTDGTDLKFYFGDHSTHAGEFIFQPGVSGTLDKNWAWPVAQVLQILKLAESSTVKMHISNEGALQLTVDSGIGEYQFILPAQSK
jgi:hypothetical protein